MFCQISIFSAATADDIQTKEYPNLNQTFFCDIHIMICKF